MKDTSTTTITARNPMSPMAALSSVTMGSVSLPDITAPMSGDRQHECQADPERRSAADVDRQAHGLRYHPARIRRLLGDIAAGLETVVAEHRGERGGEKRGPVASLRVHEGGVHQHLQRLMPREQQQIDTDDDGADQFADEAEHRDPRQQARAAQVEHRGDADENEGDRGRGNRRALEPEQLREKRRDAGGDARHRAAQRPAVHPSGHPGPAPARPGAAPRDTGRRRSETARRSRRR